MIVVGIDTGLDTGMAFWNTKIMEKPHAVEVPYAQTGTMLRAWLESALAVGGDVSVACERYVMIGGGAKTAQPEALMGMGAVEYLCHANDVPLTWQFPVDAKRLVTDGVLRQLGWYVKTKDGHANDGQRHLLKWIADNHPGMYGELLGI